ncbi:MAG: BamA/TamA family outer membrane protein [Cyanobacteria bacterium SID2]|nr:BamA/TamA family outer membrane protein [Cyanobacteria bacterium SID2]MBP0004382.1 BamA/TamA family outer membrane protein [Cyanobacteria bacterium SBC]
MNIRQDSPQVWGSLALALGATLVNPVEAAEAKFTEADLKISSNTDIVLTGKQLETVFEAQGANPIDLRRADALDLSNDELDRVAEDPESAGAIAENEPDRIPEEVETSQSSGTSSGGFSFRDPELFFEFSSPSVIRPFSGPIPIQRPEVYDSETLENLRHGFLVGGDFGIDRARGVYGGIQLGYRGRQGRSLILTGQGGEFVAGAEVSYTQPAIVGEEDRIGYRVTGGFLNTRSNAFLSDDDDDDVREVFLPIGDEHEPWVNRLGFQGQVFVPISDNTILLPGINYQKIRIQNRAFTDNLYAEDEDGNRLSVSNDGKDDLLLLSLFAQQDNANRDEYGFPLSGNVFQFGTQQSIPIGDSTVDFNRISGGYIQYLHLNESDTSPHVIIIGAQAGTHIGRVPGYEAFLLGGFHSVRGFSTGDVGTADSFAQARLEYRFPIVSWDGGFFEKLRGAVAVQYATDFGTGGDVIGEPAEARNKPGDGFGFSVGLHFIDFNLPLVDTVRATAGISDRGDFAFYFSLGPSF